MVGVDEKNIDEKAIAALWEVTDPEIPVLSIMDMGIVRQITQKYNKVFVDITPTYSGCPAMDTIAVDIAVALKKAGFDSEVRLVLSPAWTTDWITDRGRKRLEDYGIAPPLDEQLDKRILLGENRLVPCPRCGSQETKMISRFGSTACKSLFKCDDCLETFDYFKCLK